MANNPFYPASLNPYQDPLSTAGQGTTSISDAKVDLSDPELEQAKKDVKDGKICWVLFSYVGVSSKLKVESTSEEGGSANIDSVIEELHHGKPMFGFMRILLQNNTVPKFVYFSWNPAGVPPLLKGLMHGRSYDVGKFLSPYHFSVDAQNEDDLDSKKMMDKLQKAANVAVIMECTSVPRFRKITRECCLDTRTIKSGCAVITLLTKSTQRPHRKESAHLEPSSIKIIAITSTINRRRKTANDKSEEMVAAADLRTSTGGLQYEAMMKSRKISENSGTGSVRATRYARTNPPKRTSSLIDFNPPSPPTKREAARPRKSSSVGDLPGMLANQYYSGTKMSVITDTLLSDLRVLLTDFDLLSRLFRECSDLPDFPYLLFKFFESCREDLKLMRWAIHLDMGQTNEPNELFRVDSFATRLFGVLFLAEEGREFVVGVVEPLVKDVMMHGRSLETEAGRGSGNIDNGVNMRWFVQRIVDFVDRLEQKLPLCPYILRESLRLLQDGISRKFQDSRRYMCGIIFLRFLCPSVVFPEKLGIVERSVLTGDMTRGLVIAGKILQTFANGSLLRGDSQHSDVINSLITKHHPQLQNFIAELTNEESLNEARVHQEAGEIRALSPKRIQEEFTSYLVKLQHARSEPSIRKFQEKYETFRFHIDNMDDYRLCMHRRDEELYVYYLKNQNNGHPFFKAVTRVQCTLEVASRFFSCNGMLATDNSFDHLQCVEKFDEKHSDWTMSSPGNFLVGSRDWVYTLYNSSRVTVYVQIFLYDVYVLFLESVDVQK